MTSKFLLFIIVNILLCPVVSYAGIESYFTAPAYFVNNDNAPLFYFGADKSSLTTWSYDYVKAFVGGYYSTFILCTLPVSVIYVDDKQQTVVTDGGTLDIQADRRDIVNLLGVCSSLAQLSNPSVPCWYDPTDKKYTGYSVVNPDKLVYTVTQDASQFNQNPFPTNVVYDYYRIDYVYGTDANGNPIITQQTYTFWVYVAPTYIPGIPPPPNPFPPSQSQALQELIFFYKTYYNNCLLNWHLTVPNIYHDFRYHGWHVLYSPSLDSLSIVKQNIVDSFNNFYSSFSFVNIMSIKNMPPSAAYIDFAVFGSDRRINVFQLFPLMLRLRFFILMIVVSGTIRIFFIRKNIGE